jgi:catechol 2,3-dioxygenase-like lactoylglutathione lyase family enzyme
MPTFSRVTPRLPVESLTRTIAFYTERLGFVVDVVWTPEKPTFAILQRDDTSVGFFEPSEHQPGPIGYAELYIEMTDAEALHASLRPKVPVEWGPEVYSYGRREFAIRDPDRYLIIFTEPTDDPPTETCAAQAPEGQGS